MSETENNKKPIPDAKSLERFIMRRKDIEITKAEKKKEKPKPQENK